MNVENGQEPRLQRRVSLSRARQIQRFIEFFDRAGAPTDRGLERNGLPVMARERPDIFVSTRAMNAFARDMASREGIDDLSWRVGSADTAPWSTSGSSTLRSTGLE